MAARARVALRCAPAMRLRVVNVHCVRSEAVALDWQAVAVANTRCISTTAGSSTSFGTALAAAGTAGSKGPTWFKRSRRGLFAGKRRGTGNNVSFSQRKTKRHWKPNVQTKRLWSDTLNRMVKFRVTTAALRWIDKAGGLDNYLLNTPPRKLDSDIGMEYRAILQDIIRENAAAAAANSAEGGEALEA